MKTDSLATRANGLLHDLQRSLPQEPVTWAHHVGAALAERLPSRLRVVAGPATSVVASVLPAAARGASAVLSLLPLGGHHETATGTSGSPRAWGEAPSAAAARVGAPGVSTAAADRVMHDLEQPGQSEHAEPGGHPEQAGKPGTHPTSEAELPVADWDGLALGTLRARTARLDPADLAVLLEWERSHAHRLQVVTMLENRLARHAGTGDRPGASAR